MCGSSGLDPDPRWETGGLSTNADPGLGGLGFRPQVGTVQSGEAFDLLLGERPVIGSVIPAGLSALLGGPADHGWAL